MIGARESLTSGMAGIFRWDFGSVFDLWEKLVSELSNREDPQENKQIMLSVAHYR
jgi:hypothetical protein